MYPRNHVDGYQYEKIQFMTGGTMYAKEWEEPDLSFLKDEVHADPCHVDYPEVM